MLCEGNEAYKEEVYVGVEEVYWKFLEVNSIVCGYYNFGNVIY